MKSSRHNIAVSKFGLHGKHQKALKVEITATDQKVYTPYIRVAVATIEWPCVPSLLASANIGVRCGVEGNLTTARSSFFFGMIK